MEEKKNCPWCNEQVIFIKETSSRQYGEVVERRCPKCRGLVSTRLKGIPEAIIKKV